MRPPQNNKRMRGRSNNNGNRRGPNPLTRSYESNGPDVKVRGTAAHIAEKYVQLARDAHVSGDPVAAESYLQHAEHYFRLIAAAQLAQNPPPRSLDNGTVADVSPIDDGEDEDFDGGVSDRFTYRAPQSYQAPAAGQPFQPGDQSASPTDPGADQPEQPVYGERQDNRQDRQDNRQDNRNGNRFDNRNRFEPRRDNRNGQPRGNDFQRNDNRDGNRFDPQQRRDRAPRNDRGFDQQRSDQQRFDPARADQPRMEPPRSEQPRGDNMRHEGRGERNFEPRSQRAYPAEIADVQPILPSFITAPVRAVNSADEAEERLVPLTPPAAASDEAPAPRPRRRRKVVAAHEEGEAPVSAVDTTAAE